DGDDDSAEVGPPRQLEVAQRREGALGELFHQAGPIVATDRAKDARELLHRIVVASAGGGAAAGPVAPAGDVAGDGREQDSVGVLVLEGKQRVQVVGDRPHAVVVLV